MGVPFVTQLPDEEEKLAAQAQMLANRVKKRHRHLYKRFARQGIDVFRLYDWDIPEIRAVVDWYAGHLVVGEYMRDQSFPGWLPRMGAAVAEILAVPLEHLHLKRRVYGRRAGERRYERIDTTDRTIVVSERDLRFCVNPWDYVDTGLFGDHRDTRQMVRRSATGKTFLNLFCYSGAFTCYAAWGGAIASVSVDRSKSAIQWAKQNFALNRIDTRQHRLVQTHAYDYLSAASNRAQRFDLAVVDPPSFYTRENRSDHFDVARDHTELLNAVVVVMRPGGTIYFSTNHQDFTLHSNAVDAARIQEITDQTIPEDYRHKRKQIHRCWRLTV
ncbi:MAG: SAM-dependent methyltransferase [Desulfatitalea sp.]|nr:class I SAM-dependent methyltransferase [Desulfatitalea sp.]NNJ99190.1 SAM-dependent methyltransferase [Desulfatitalea sp.]